MSAYRAFSGGANNARGRFYYRAIHQQAPSTFSNGEELKESLRKQKDARLKERVQALYLLKMEQVIELKELARIVGRDPSTLYRWFDRYKVGGLASLLELGYV